MLRLWKWGVGLLLWGTAQAALAAPSVQWTQVGYPWAARKIAACSNGALYAANDNGTIYVNRAGGADSGWVYLGVAPGSVQSLTCVNGQLFLETTGRDVYADGHLGQGSVSWSFVEHDFAAAQFQGNDWASQPGADVKYVALNDDKSLWIKSPGAGWSRAGTPTSADRIAVGLTPNAEVRIFALNTNKDLFLNWGNGGCDGYWAKIDHPWNAIEIAARDSTHLYALNADYTLWAGTVQGAEGLIASTGYNPGSTCLVDNLVPMYQDRYDWGSDGDRYYSTDLAGEQNLANTSGNGWHGVYATGFRCHTNPAPGTVMLERTFSGYNSDHFYATDWNELNWAFQNSFSDEGVACYVYPRDTQVPFKNSLCPLWRLYAMGSGNRTDHYYTTSASLAQAAQAHGYQLDHPGQPEAYVWPSGTHCGDGEYVPPGWSDQPAPPSGSATYTNLFYLQSDRPWDGALTYYLDLSNFSCPNCTVSQIAVPSGGRVNSVSFPLPGNSTADCWDPNKSVTVTAGHTVPNLSALFGSNNPPIQSLQLYVCGDQGPIDTTQPVPDIPLSITYTKP